MSVPAIGGVTPIGGAPSIAPASGTAGAAGGGFASELAAGLDHLQQLQTNADDLAVQAATGSLTDVHDYLIASTQAALATQLTVAVRNKAVEAFNDIMRMQA